MKNKFSRLTLFTLVAAALVAAPAGRAEDKPAAKNEAPVIEKRTPFHGQVTAVDTAAMTLAVGALTLNVTSETMITKGGKPATLADLTVGDTAGGSYKKDDAGKLSAATIRVVVKAQNMEKKKKAANTAPAEPAPKN